jgi:hypothetical protein
MTPQFIDTILLWGFADPLFYADGVSPSFRIGWRGLPSGEELYHFTALRWPA